MTNRDHLVDMRQALTAQRSILQEADKAVSALERNLGNTNTPADIQELEELISQIEQDSAFLEPDDLKGWTQDDVALSVRYDQTMTRYTEYLETLQFRSWQQFVRDSQVYCLSQGSEPILPWEAMLTDETIAQIKAESYEAQYQWDEWDYIMVGSAGLLAFLTDVFWVATPAKSPITSELKSLKLPPAVQNWLEMKAIVPYDHTGGVDHRIDTFGHDPVLGFIMGTLNIMRGGVTAIKGGDIAFQAGLEDPISNPLTALITQFLHMLSDVTTSKGLPVPFAPVLRALKVGSFQCSSGQTKTVSQMVLWMYHNGYDLRHFVTMGITPATIEIILRAYLMLRHYSLHGETEFRLADNPKYRSMLLSAHAVACAGNAGKIALLQGNPMAINYAEWLALLRYLMPSLKYWLFDEQRLKVEHMEHINEQAWQELCQSSDNLLKQVYENTAPVFALGKAVGDAGC